MACLSVLSLIGKILHKTFPTLLSYEVEITWTGDAVTCYMHFLVFCNICKCKARYIKAQSAAVTTQRSQLRNGLPLDPVVPCFHWSSLWYVTVFFSFLIFLSTVQLILIYILKAVAVLPSPLSSLPTPGLWMGRRQCHTHGPGRCLCRYRQTSSFANDFCIFWENRKIMSFN